MTFDDWRWLKCRPRRRQAASASICRTNTRSNESSLAMLVRTLLSVVSAMPASRRHARAESDYDEFRREVLRVRRAAAIAKIRIFPPLASASRIMMAARPVTGADWRSVSECRGDRLLKNPF